jgi:hypothetical protein
MENKTRILLAKQLLLCVISTIQCIYWKRLNNCHCFLGKGRTWKVCIAQKTPKNKRLKLSEKRNRKLFFLEIIRDFLPKYLRKTLGLYF